MPKNADQQADGKRIRKLLDRTGRVIPYRPELARFAGSVHAAILLQQIVFRWIWNDCLPFFKFKEPCNHKLYRKGDSWTEELAFTRREFDSALRLIATRRQSEDAMEEALAAGKPVITWRTGDNRPYYTVNLEALEGMLMRVAGPSARLPARSKSRPRGRKRKASNASREAPRTASNASREPPRKAPNASRKESKITQRKRNKDYFFLQLLDDLKLELPSEVFDWLMAGLQGELRDGCLILRGPARAIAMLQARHKPQIERAVAQIAGETGLQVNEVRFEEQT